MTTHTASARLRTPEEIALHAGLDFPRLLLPEDNVFGLRALRLRELSANHAMRDYLLLMAALCEAQQARLSPPPTLQLPSEADAEAASQAGEPLLEATRWPREAIWRIQWRALMADVLASLGADNPARNSVHAIAQWDDAALEQQASRLLGGITLGLDLAAAPLIAAGLQLYFTHLVRATAAAQQQPFGITRDATRCPCCGSLPAASVTRLGGMNEGLRYLHCALCSSQWHMVRIKCTHCLDTGAVRYQALAPLSGHEAHGQRAAVQAETCGVCAHYLKIVHMNKDVHVDPVADDLASLTLDLLVAEEGYTRHGVNYMLLFGEGEGSDGRPAPESESEPEPKPERGRR